LIEPSLDELDGGAPAMSAVRPVHLLADPPVLDEDLGFEQKIEELAVQELLR